MFPIFSSPVLLLRSLGVMYRVKCRHGIAT